jgi:HEPN domain-containing protein
MNRTDFQRLSNVRLQEAKALLADGFPEGAYYLAGYAVECALKACIARKTQQYDFPDKTQVNESYTHNLRELMRIALLRDELAALIQTDLGMRNDWNIVQSWSESSRYESKTLQEATELLEAIETSRGGLLPWVRQRW